MSYRPIKIGPGALLVRWSTDPETYVDRDTLERIPAFILMQAYEEAQRVYYSCGGHKLAARMNRAMTVIGRELRDRGIFPNYSRGGLRPGWNVP